MNAANWCLCPASVAETVAELTTSTNEVYSSRNQERYALDREPARVLVVGQLGAE